MQINHRVVVFDAVDLEGESGSWGGVMLLIGALFIVLGSISVPHEVRRLPRPAAGAVALGAVQSTPESATTGTRSPSCSTRYAAGETTT